MVTRTHPAFISAVEFQGKIFKGEPGRSKIQAQRNAAKVACQHFEKIKSLNQLPSYQWANLITIIAKMKVYFLFIIFQNYNDISILKNQWKKTACNISTLANIFSIVEENLTTFSIAIFEQGWWFNFENFLLKLNMLFCQLSFVQTNASLINISIIVNIPILW